MNGLFNNRFERQIRLMAGSSSVCDRIVTDLNDMFAVSPHHGPERRAFIRLPYETEACGLVSDAHEGIVRVQNVSRIGLQLAAPCPLTAGAPVSMVFGDVYHKDAPVSLDGHVIWAYPDGPWHRAGVVLDHTGSQTIAAASELFYAAMAGVSSRFASEVARSPRE